jgi:general secretion pathway protein D
MNKTYISSLLVVLIGAQTIRAQESLDDVFAQLDAAQGGTEQAAPAAAPAAASAVAPAPAAVQTMKSAEVDANDLAALPVAAVPQAADTDLMARGLAYYNDGELDKAEAVFEAVLAEDPYNRRAMEFLKRTAQKTSANELALQRASRAKALAEVDGAWNPDPKVVAIPVDASAGPAKTANELAIEAMTARLQKIMIPSLDFRDANIKDVVLFLTETCRRQDPKQGVNILLLGMDDSMTAEQDNITISIRDMSLYEALQYIVEMASLKFDVQAKAVAVMPIGYVSPTDLKLVSYTVNPEVGQELEDMSGGGGGGGVDDLFGDASATTSSSAGPADVSEFFSIVEWPDGSQATYYPKFHRLTVKNTPKNLKAVENILDDLEDEAIRKRSQQVEIEAKFVEYNEGALEELGFDWTLYDTGTFAGLSLADSSTQTFYQPGQGPTTSTDLPGGGTLYTDPTTGYTEINSSTGTGQSLFGSSTRSSSTAFEDLQSGILATMGGTPAEMILSNTSSFPFDLAITAMEQEGTADVLSAPKVTTKSGNEAIIRVVEVHRYPQDYDVETGQRTAPVVKPQDWEDYDLGVVLKVTPVVDSESNTIDLDLQPEINKFKGFDSYIAGYNSYESGDDSTVLLGNSAALEILMPYFETRTVQTQVTIADGSTVVMGGLVDERTETFRDQVPFLGDIPYIGRLFRSEGSRSSKKNLVISVKATQVDEHGMTRDQRELARQAAAN